MAAYCLSHVCMQQSRKNELAIHTNDRRENGQRDLSIMEKTLSSR